MSVQPFKFRHLDSIVGAFVIGAVAIAIGSFLLVGTAKSWFTGKREIVAESAADPTRGEFLDELSEGLRPGTPVELGGEVVGQVVAASVADGVLSMRLEVAERSLALMHANAYAVIKVPLAPFMGQNRVVLKPGHGSGRPGWPKDGPPVPIQPPRNSTAMAMAVLRDLEANLGPLLAAARGMLTEGQAMIAEVRAQRLPQQAGELLNGLRDRRVAERLDALLARTEAIAAAAEAATADARRIAAAVAAGEGLAGRAINDARLGGDVAALAGDLRAITAELRRAAPALPSLAEGGTALLDEVQRLVDGLSRHWLLRAYAAPDDPGLVVPGGIVAPPSAPEPRP